MPRHSSKSLQTSLVFVLKLLTTRYMQMISILVHVTVWNWNHISTNLLWILDFQQISILYKLFVFEITIHIWTYNSYLNLRIASTKDNRIYGRTNLVHNALITCSHKICSSNAEWHIWWVIWSANTFWARFCCLFPHKHHNEYSILCLLLIISCYTLCFS